MRFESLRFSWNWKIRLVCNIAVFFEKSVDVGAGCYSYAGGQGFMPRLRQVRIYMQNLRIYTNKFEIWQKTRKLKKLEIVKKVHISVKNT